MRDAAAPFIAALEDMEVRWERAKEPDEDGPLPDELQLRPALIEAVPTVAHARALRRAASPTEEPSRHAATE